ncbi:MAG: putative selenate reductase subunit YgfK [Bacteroidales bacterium]
MTDKFYTVPVEQLLQMILSEFQNNHSIFGINSDLFFNPNTNKALSTEIFGQKIDTPLGVAAGPHTQLAQNIIVSWLMGCRYIELKTIQTLDELEISKPCIDMQDEGYNCEWSQELKIQQSFNEYLNAWVIIHILNHELGYIGTPKTIFNMSVGYNLEGIKQPNVQWFFNKMASCKNELVEKIELLRPIYPDIDKINIPYQLSNNITLSTMHGCPANEIEDIAKYLLSEKKLHTFVKLNPTLLGPQELRRILNTNLKFKTNVPDIAFEHDLKYPDAVKIINSLQQTADSLGLTFGLKLTNTLESVNIKNTFKSDVDMMYMSGRALHPISINVARKLQNEFKGKLLLSFSAGINAFNVSDSLKCGFKTVTVSSDLLKPGGYTRINQYVQSIMGDIERNSCASMAELVGKEPAHQFLQRYADDVLSNKLYTRDHLREPSIKTKRSLDYFDCISAPCRDTCATNQDIPDYLYFTATKQFDKALEVILKTNPFPSITGMVCDHQCQNKCTRINYDDSLLIREVKRFIAENSSIKLNPATANGKSAAIVGAGPSGLSCAFYLAVNGFKVDVFEAHSQAGGMVKYAIPGFRLTNDAINRDFSRLSQLGVNIAYNHKIDKDEFSRLKSSYDYVYLSPGAQKSASLNIEGIESSGVIDPLSLLFGVKDGSIKELGSNVVIVGGGNTAMDSARTAHRLVGSNGKVTVVYRRTIDEMPADEGEISAVIAEGIQIVELTAPEKVIAANGKVKALLCSRMELNGVDAKGRPNPVKVPNSDYEIECDVIIPAVGQALDINFVPAELLKADTRTYKTLLGNVYIGGDALRGASTAINAIGDGRKAAEQIIKQSGFTITAKTEAKNHSRNDLMAMRSTRKFAPEVNSISLDDSRTFKLVSQTLDENTIVEEAKRCLNCDEICNICTTVCPNLANFSYQIEPVSFKLQKVVVNDGKMDYQPDNDFSVRQKYQIINIANFCNECGNCRTFCPTESAPYMAKPKLHITTESFNKCDEGYMLVQLKDRLNLIYKQQGGIKTLSQLGSEFIYETDHVLARFNRKDFSLLEVQVKTPCVRQVQFQHAAEMSIIMQGAKSILSR